MIDDREERIRERAHAIWEREGRPDGMEAEHWRRAAIEVDAENDPFEGAPAGDAPAPGLVRGGEVDPDMPETAGLGAVARAAAIGKN